MLNKLMIVIAALSLSGCFYGGGYGGGGYQYRPMTAIEGSVHRNFENSLYPTRTQCMPLGGGFSCQTI